MAFRMSSQLHEKLIEAAANKERSLSEEIERRLEDSFLQTELVEAVSHAASVSALSTMSDLCGGDVYFKFGLQMAQQLAYEIRRRNLSVEMLAQPQKSDKKLEKLIEFMEGMTKTILEVGFSDKLSGFSDDMGALQYARLLRDIRTDQSGEQPHKIE